MLKDLPREFNPKLLTKKEKKSNPIEQTNLED